MKLKFIYKISNSFSAQNKKEIKRCCFFLGEIGDWKNHFTVAMNEHFDAVYKEEMKDSNIKIQFE